MGLDDKKKVSIIGISSILLVAAVVGTVTYGVNRNTGAASSGNPSEGGNGGVQTSSKSVQAMCQPTDYKEACENSLAGAKNTSDPKELIKVAFEATEKQIGDAIKNSALLQEAAKDPRTSQALDNCKELLETSIDDLKRSFDKVGTFDVTQMDEYIADLKTWLSGAITYQETCLDGFENTTGETGEKMKKLLKTSAELSSNGLAMVTELSSVLKDLQIPGISRRLMSEEEEDSKQNVDEEGYPDFVDAAKRKLLQANPTPNAVVAQDGSGKFKTIMDAVRTVPKNNKTPFVILVKAGIYKEYVEIPRKTDNVVLIGEGPTKTKITGNKNYVDGVATFKTATVVVSGDGFIAKNIGIENSAGAMKHQAVALRVSADKSIFFNCQMDGYQDTLYTHSYRQYYRDCVITGTIDFIFGDASAVFQNCKMIVRKPLLNQDCMVTAQGRKDHRGVGAIVLQNCQITADKEFVDFQTASKGARKAYLGRPWKEYSRTIVMQSFIDSTIAPEGWSPWAGTFGLDTLYFGEYQNRGPGSNTNLRVTWKGIQKMTPEMAESFTLGKYILVGEDWIKPTGVPYVPGMMKV
ncbi:hypothetical protein M9H77_36843 [Catharanthus roseus]|uniref:Uncharacterized protein n=1 Tax=Catharanthus roseus TaxID=4058 RepID=A0ACB9ZTA6_CATRO|nr:hypothetical protein M9H77_36843 [Catharanthus roseus]